MTDTVELPPETRLGRTVLRVTAREPIADFYRDVVGLSVLHRTNDTSVLGVGETPLLVVEEDENADERGRSGTGLFHIAFSVPSREAFGDAVARIQDRWVLDGASDHGVSEAVYLSDPEGNGIEIYRDFPREGWPIADDGSIRMGTYPLDLDSVTAGAGGSSSLPAGTDVGHIHLEVSSLAAFRDFYVDVIGFAVQMESPAALFVSAGGYHHHIGANTWNNRSEPVAGRGLSWFEVVLPEPVALAEVRGRIADSQYPVTEMEDTVAVTGPDDIEVRFRVEP